MKHRTAYLMLRFFSSALRAAIDLFWPAAIVLAIHAGSILFFALDYTWDELLHALGGASMAWAAWRACRRWQAPRRLPDVPVWFLAAFSLFFAVFAGVLWEFYEYIAFVTWAPQFDLTLRDTIKDLAFDLGGAAAACLLLGKVRHQA